MFNFNKVNFLYEENFDVFVIENFLNPAIYNEIKENIPNLKLSDFNERFIINNKIGLQPGDEMYEKNILSNTVLKKLHNEIFNKNFIKKIINIFLPKILKARKKDLHYLTKLLLRKNRYLETQGKKKDILEKFFFNDIFSSIQYSFMHNNSKIVPHTDSKAKLVSLMLYFPDENLSNEHRLQLGTTFYDNNTSNLKNVHLSDEVSEANFVKNSKEILTLPFKPYNLYGFIRNEKSWHSVKKISMEQPDFIRKSININLLFN
jgi:hypothetical protein